MPSFEREMSRDRAVKHQHSFSESGRLSVPMWDSSDPDRAPPPLPMNPANPDASPTRSDSSAKIAAAAQQLLERARQNAAGYPRANSTPDRSPERSPTKTPLHKRLQSLQNGSPKDLKSCFEDLKTPDRSPSRSATPGRDESGASEENVESPTPVASSKDASRDEPLRSSSRSSRPHPRPILGENTPPSATMQAIQNMPYRDVESPLANISNSSIPRTPATNFDGISTQLQNLTSIATTLQKEMAALSRRSRDNATDLVALKDATKSRDEEVRKSLRELVSHSKTFDTGLFGTSRADMSRSSSALGMLHLLEPRLHGSPPLGKGFSLPRIPPPHGLESSADHDRAASPSPFSVEGAASVAMLEKIIREMVTKEGQERLLTTLSELLEKSREDSSGTAKKVDELLDFIRGKSQSKALVKHRGGLCDDFGDDVTDSTSNAVSNKPPAAAFVSDELVKLMQKTKDSVAQSGGLTGEVKSLVRELRGEVLGMGRELGRQLESLNRERPSLERSEGREDHGELQRVVEEGLDQLKNQMEMVIDSNRRRSSSSTTSRNAVDNSEVYAVVKHALAEHGLEHSLALQSPAAAFDQQAILDAVRDAYEAYKPEIELQQFGLERDEILQCLREGLEDYQSNKTSHESNNISRDDIMKAVQDAMHGFIPPQPPTEAFEIKEEILASVKECLDNFKPPGPERTTWKPGDITREDVMDAVREELGVFKREGARQIEISREDLFHAVKAGLDSTQTPFGGYGDQVLNSLYEIVDGMRVEFKEYSAANGRDTEQVLDAMKDGLETLRGEIETYVDKAKDVTERAELQNTLRDGLQDLKSQVTRSIAEIDKVSARTDMVDFIKAEFERLQNSLSGSTQTRSLDRPMDDVAEGLNERLGQLQEVLLNNTALQKDELLDAVQESLNSLHTKLEYQNQQRVPDNGDKMEIANALRESLDGIRVQLAADQSEAASESLGAIREELESLRKSMSSALTQSQTVNESEAILAAVQDTLEELKSQIIQKSDPSAQYSSSYTETIDSLNDSLRMMRGDLAKMANNAPDVLSALTSGLSEIKADMQHLKSAGLNIKNRDVILADDSPSVDARDFAHNGRSTQVRGSELEKVEVMLAQLQIKVEAMDQNIQNSVPNSSHHAVEKEDLGAIEVILQTIQSSIAALPSHAANMSENSVTKDDVDALETLLQNTKAKLDEQILPELEAVATKDHLDNLEALVRVNGESFESLSTRIDDKVASTRSDIEALALMLEESSTAINALKDRMPLDDPEDKVYKVDIDALQDICTGIKLKLDGTVGPDLLPSKQDIEQLSVLVEDFRKSHESMKDRYESDISVTAKAFDDRKAEAKSVLDQIEELKSFVAESRDDIKSSVTQNADDMHAMGIVLQTIEDKIDESPNAIEDVQEAKRLIKIEFEKANSSFDGIRADQRTQTASILAKNDEHKASIVSELAERLEGNFNEILGRQDLQQQATEHAMRAASEKSVQHENILQESRTIVEDLRLTIDTLGASVTAIAPALEVATDRMGDDAKTVFNKVEDVYNKFDYNHEENKTEHQLTRDEVLKALGAISVLHEAVNGFQPKFMDALSSMAVMVEEHFKHSKRSQELSQEHAQKASEHFQDIKTSFQAIPVPRLEGPSVSAEDKPDDSKLHGKLDELLHLANTSTRSQGSDPPENPEIMSKLNELLSCISRSEDIQVHSDKIHDMHRQTLESAAEISAFVAFQNKMITAQHESKDEEAKQAAVELSRCQAEAQQLESTMSTLRETKQTLTAEIETLRAEQQNLQTQKLRLSGDVASLETALQLRREELQTMDARADALENRIIERVMDHSRALLISKPPRPPPPNMSLKRVSSVNSSGTAATATPSSALNEGIGIALNSTNGTRRTRGSVNPTARRILSLNQITNNVPAGGKNLTAAPRNPSSGIENLKRSHTVRNPGPRKTSWIPQVNRESVDKENANLSEGSEGEPDSRAHGTSTSMTNRSMSYAGTSSSRSDRQASYSSGASEYSYTTGSYITGTETDRRTSVGSTIRSTLGVATSFEDSIHEDEEDPEEVDVDKACEEEGSDREGDQPVEEVLRAEHKSLILSRPPDGYDSGLGSDLPTATVSQHGFGDDYFVPGRGTGD